MVGRLRIALYSGIIPSAPFIERLIEGLASEGLTILLFGKLKARPTYSDGNIHVIGNRDDVVGILVFMIRYLRFRLLFRSRFLKLKNHLASGPFASIRSFRRWQKFLPVVLNLPDVFHVQWAKAAGEWFFLKEEFNVKLVLSLRGSHINYSPLADTNLAEMYRSVFPKYDAYHGVCDAIVRVGLGFGVRKKVATVIYSGVEPSPLAPREKIDGERTIALLAVGRMHWIKGYSYLLDSLAILRNRNYPFFLTLVAPGKMPEEILYQLHELKLGDRVKWKKSLPHSQVLAEMEMHDILVLPSIEEGIANVVLEAMGVGLPVISTTCGGMEEVICDGVNGILVPVRNPLAMAEAIIRFADVPQGAINELRARAHDTITQKFNRRKNVSDFVKLYEKVMACG